MSQPTFPSAPVRRRGIPAWAWVLIAVGAVMAAGALVVVLITAGIIGFGAGGGASSDQQRDLDFTRVDASGSSACNYLDMHLGGLGSFDDARRQAATATTATIKNATTPRVMYDACVAAGANMSPWREPGS